MVAFYSWAGTVLYIDLTEGKIRKEPLSPEFAQKYLGGIGFNSVRLFELVKPGVDAISPENVIMFGVGPLAGTLYPGSPRLTITAKSPLTDVFGSTNLGGHFGPELKSAGYDQMVITGKSPKSVYVRIDDDDVQLKDASHLWGKSTWETGLRLKEEFNDPEIQVLVIGQAGENLVRSANIINPPRGAGGRSGMGAVMGSKNLKAIAVRGTRPVKVARLQEFVTICKESTIFGRTEPRYNYLRGGGSPHWVDLSGATGVMGVKNYTRQVHPNWQAISGDKFRPGAGYSVRKRGCASCPICCSGFFNIRDGEFAQTFGRVPEAGTTIMGLKCDMPNIPALLKLQELFDNYGLDCISVGDACAWAMDCFSRGILTKEDCEGVSLDWGNYTAIMELVPKIARREGFLANLLAEGEKRAPRMLGRGSEKFMHHVKGMSPPGEDPRALPLYGLAYYTAPRGCDHLSANTIWARDLLRGTEMERELFGKYQKYGTAPSGHATQDVEGIGEALKVCENISAIINSVEVCTRTGGSFDYMAKALSAATGLDLNVEKLLVIGERIFNVEKAFNAREGLTRRDDNFANAEKFTKEPLEEGDFKGNVLNLEPMLDDYYRARGWDIGSGLQTRGKLEELGLDWLIPELARAQAIR